MPGIIPENFIQQLLAKIDIVDVIGLRLKLKKAGSSFITTCPFHKEKTPSFSVNRDRQFYHCFGCSKSGDAIQFLIEYENVTFVDAVETLASIAGMEIPKSSKFNKNLPNSSKEGQTKNSLSRVYACLQSARDFFINNLHKTNPISKPAIEYLKNRGITGATAKHFGMGYVANTRNSLFKSLFNHYQINELEQAGLIITNSDATNSNESTNLANVTISNNSLHNNVNTSIETRDRFRGRIIFPIRDRRGRTVGFGGRIIGDGQPKYLNSPETPVFNKSKELYGLYENRRSISSSSNMLVVEGYMDVVSLWQAGINNSVATLGTALTDQHIKILFSLKDEVVFCFDGDAAGQKALWRAVELCLPLLDGVKQAKFLLLPDTLDPDSFIKAKGVDKFNTLLSRSMSIYDFIFYKLTLDLDLAHIDGKSALVARVKPLIDVINASFLKDLLFERLAQLTGIDKSYLVNNDKNNQPSISYSDYQQNMLHSPRLNSKESVKKLYVTKGSKAQQRILPAIRAAALLFNHRNLVKLIPDTTTLEKINLPGVKFFVSLSMVLKDNPHALDSEIREKIPNDCLKYFNPKELRAIAEIVPETGIESEFCDSLEYLSKAKLNQGLDELLDLAKNGTLSEQGKRKLWEMVNASKES